MLRKTFYFFVFVLLVCTMAACSGNKVSEQTQTNESSGNQESAGSAEEVTFPEKGSDIRLINLYKMSANQVKMYDALEKALQKVDPNYNLQIDEQAGGGGQKGLGIAKEAEPDGYTWTLSTIVSLVLQPLQNETTYTKDDFDHLRTFFRYVYGIVAPADAPYDTFEEFVAYAKENPGMKYGTASIGSLTHLSMEQIADMVGIELEVVPFNDTASQGPAMLQGDLDISHANVGSLKQWIETGDLKLITVTSDSRYDWAPDVPTLIDLGYDFDSSSIGALSVPKGVPEPILTKIRSDLREAVKDPEFLKVMNELEQPPVDWEPEEWTEYLGEFEDMYTPVLEEFGLLK
jgi:tripartite-type tricarboxylate transporter receptor subunit TctC